MKVAVSNARIVVGANAIYKEVKMKVVFITGIKDDKGQEVVNDFIADKKVIDIKYDSVFVSTKYKDGTPIEGSFYSNIMIMYEDN